MLRGYRRGSRIWIETERGGGSSDLEMAATTIVERVKP
jgi:hypothetical protein